MNTGFGVPGGFAEYVCVDERFAVPLPAALDALAAAPLMCAGAIFESRIHQSPARLRAADYVSLKIEFELAFRLAEDLPAAKAPFTAAGMLAVDTICIHCVPDNR